MTFIRPTVHVIRDTPVAKLFRRRLKCEDIFTFFSLETGQWILAYWIEKRIRMADEIEDLGMNLELVNSAFVKRIVDCWGPINWKEKKKRMISRFATRETKDDEKVIEQSDKYRWLQKRMKKPIPYAFSTPISGGQ